jgi:hypothetical protein
MSEKSQKPYTAYVVDAEGQELCNKGFDSPQRAKGKVCRVLAENPGAKGKFIYNNVVLPSTGLPMEEVVTREHAMRNLHGSKGGPVMFSKKGGNPVNNMKAIQTRCSFSHG